MKIVHVLHALTKQSTELKLKYIMQHVDFINYF